MIEYYFLYYKKNNMFYVRKAQATYLRAFVLDFQFKKLEMREALFSFRNKKGPIAIDGRHFF
jgi:hypothetical protein